MSKAQYLYRQASGCSNGKAAQPLQAPYLQCVPSYWNSQRKCFDLLEGNCLDKTCGSLWHVACSRKCPFIVFLPVYELKYWRLPPQAKLHYGRIRALTDFVLSYKSSFSM